MKKKAEGDEAAKKKAEEDEAAKKKAEEDEAAKKKAEEDEAAKDQTKDEYCSDELQNFLAQCHVANLAKSLLVLSELGATKPEDLKEVLGDKELEQYLKQGTKWINRECNWA